MPAAVLIAPDRIDVEEVVHGEPYPVFGSIDFAEKSDAGFTQLVPGAVVVAGIGIPEMPRAQIVVHLVAANLYHFAADVLFLFRKQVVDERVGPREIVDVRHTRFIVVPVVGAALGIPFGAFEKNSLGLLPVLLLTAQQPGKSERRRTVEGIDRIGAVSPPDLPPLLALVDGARRILRRLLRRRRVGENSIALFHEIEILVLQLAASKFSQPLQILGTHEEPGMGFRNSGDQLLTTGQGHLHGAVRNRKTPRLAPPSVPALLVFAAVTPCIAARPEGSRRTMHVEFDAGGLVNDVRETGVGSALDFPRQAFLRPPTKARWIRLRHNSLVGPVAPRPGLRGPLIQLQRLRGHGACEHHGTNENAKA